MTPGKVSGSASDRYGDRTSEHLGKNKQGEAVDLARRRRIVRVWAFDDVPHLREDHEGGRDEERVGQGGRRQCSAGDVRRACTSV